MFAAFWDAWLKYDASPRALRAVPRGVKVPPPFDDERATTRRDCAPDAGIATRADVADVPAARALVALRALVAVRGTTRRVLPKLSVLTAILIGFKFCDVDVPGFSSVRIWLFIYGYI